MHFDFFKQRVNDAVSTGDEIALYSDRGDDLQSGRYMVASLESDDKGTIIATLLGMNFLQGHITVVDIGTGEPA